MPDSMSWRTASLFIGRQSARCVGRTRDHGWLYARILIAINFKLCASGQGQGLALVQVAQNESGPCRASLAVLSLAEDHMRAAVRLERIDAPVRQTYVSANVLIAEEKACAQVLF